MPSGEKSEDLTKLAKKSTIEELLYYKGQPALFYPAHLQDEDDHNLGRLFPAKLAFTFSMAHILCGILLVVFGSVAIMVDASLSYLGSGLWSGVTIFLAGVVGVATCHKPTSSVRIVSFLTMSLICVALSGLTIVLSATGLAGDTNAPVGVYIDTRGKPLSFMGEVNTTASAVATSSIIVVLSIVGCLLSLANCVITGREACQCYETFNSSSADSQISGPEYEVRRDYLLSWLGQQAILNSLPPLIRSSSSLVKAEPLRKWPDQLSSIPTSAGTVSSVPTRVSTLSSTKSTVPQSRISAYKDSQEIDDSSGVERQVDDIYTAVDKQLAEDYIERLQNEEKRYYEHLANK